MKRLIRTSQDIFAMSNVRGRYVVNPEQLDFSFYFSSGAGVDHSIRVKPVFDPEKLKVSLTGTLKLCDDWEYEPGPNDIKVSQKRINRMKQFFRQYLVLFAAVWDEQMQDATLEDYFKGQISFNEMLQDLSFYEDYSEELDTIDNVQDLEVFCIDNDLVNMYGNA